MQVRIRQSASPRTRRLDHGPAAHPAVGCCPTWVTPPPTVVRPWLAPNGTRSESGASLRRSGRSAHTVDAASAWTRTPTVAWVAQGRSEKLHPLSAGSQGRLLNSRTRSCRRHSRLRTLGFPTPPKKKKQKARKLQNLNIYVLYGNGACGASFAASFVD